MSKGFEWAFHKRCPNGQSARGKSCDIISYWKVQTKTAVITTIHPAGLKMDNLKGGQGGEATGPLSYVPCWWAPKRYLQPRWETLWQLLINTHPSCGPATLLPGL